jgi:hypothetical protein
MRRSNVALRLQASLLEEARRVAEAEGVALNQFINVAVVEKLSALRTEDYSANAHSAPMPAEQSEYSSARARAIRRGRATKWPSPGVVGDLAAEAC